MAIQRFGVVRIAPARADSWAILEVESGHLVLHEDYERLELRVAEAERLLRKMCEAANFMPDDVAAWLTEGAAGSDWIACAERYPELDVPVLVFGPGDYFPGSAQAVARWMGRRIGEGWYVSGVHGYDYELDIQPTHWRPLPAAPARTAGGSGESL